MESITTCQVCYLNYDTKDNAPRCLPCGHILCPKCLAKILNDRNLRKCPFDKIAFLPAQNSLAYFPVSFAIRDVLEQRKTNTCETHPGERLKFICLTDQTNICSECAKEKEHQGHKIKKIKALKAQGAKVKEQLQETLSDVRNYEQKKGEDLEKLKKVLISIIDGQLKEIQNVLEERRFEWVQQLTNIFDENKKNDSEEFSSFEQQINKTMKDIVEACQSENGDLAILEREIGNDHLLSKERPQFLKEKFSRLQTKILEMQGALMHSLKNSRMGMNSISLASHEFVKEIYSAQEETKQLSQEELSERQKKFSTIKLTSHWQYRKDSEIDLKIFANRSEPEEIEIHPDDFEGIDGICIELSEYNALINEPSPNLLSYILNKLENIVELSLVFSPRYFQKEYLSHIGNIIQNYLSDLVKISVNLTDCEFAGNSMQILCDAIFSKTINLDCFNLDLESCKITDEDIKLLIQTIQSSHKCPANIFDFTIGLRNNKLTDSGVAELLKFIRSLKKLRDLHLDLSELQISDGIFQVLGEKCLPSLQHLQSVTLFLNGSPISDEGINSILRNLPKLKALELDLSDTSLTDQTLKMFLDEKLPSLESLSFLSLNAHSTQISQESRNRIHEISESFRRKYYREHGMDFSQNDVEEY